MRIEIKDKKDCCGCAACFNICPKHCINMEQDFEGFSYPTIDTGKCTGCGSCVRVCPVMDADEGRETPIQIETDAYACINQNETMRLQSSSGGMFILLAQKILAAKGAVYGAAFDSDTSVSHIKIEKKNDLFKILGSKYLQSKISSTYRSVKEDLDTGKTVLFSGTPCQCAGLKQYLMKDYKNLYLIDFICHGVPSPAVWEEYLKALELRSGHRLDRHSVPSFRDKAKGWTHFMIKIPFENAAPYHQNFGQDLYMRTFLKNISLRPSCYECRFKPSTVISDITLGDFWGIKKCLPEMFDDKGTSAVLLNSPKGKALFKELADQIEARQITYDLIAAHNSSLYRSVQMPPMRKFFFEKFRKENILDLMRKCTKESFIKRCIKALLIQAQHLFQKSF